MSLTLKKLSNLSDFKYYQYFFSFSDEIMVVTTIFGVRTHMQYCDWFKKRKRGEKLIWKNGKKRHQYVGHRAFLHWLSSRM